MYKIDSLMAEVETVLRMYKRARNDDTYLTIMIWKRHGALKGGIVNGNELYKLPKASNIERCRRRVQQKAREMMDLYLGEGWDNEYLKMELQPFLEVMPTDPKVITQRKFGEDAWRSWASEN